MIKPEDLTDDTRTASTQPVTIRRVVTVGLSVRDLAEAFTVLAADEQAAFFELVGEVMGDWHPHQREMQLHYMAREILDNKDSRALVDAINESVVYLATHKEQSK